MIDQGQFDELVESYSRTAASVLRETVHLLDTGLLPGAVSKNRLPRHGSIDLQCIGSTTYRFHGRGCYFSSKTTTIDIELPNCPESVGFDAWRLYLFARETLRQRKITLDDVRQELDRQVQSGRLLRVDASPYFGLYIRVTTLEP